MKIRASELDTQHKPQPPANDPPPKPKPAKKKSASGAQLIVDDMQRQRAAPDQCTDCGQVPKLTGHHPDCTAMRPPATPKKPGQ